MSLIITFKARFFPQWHDRDENVQNCTLILISAHTCARLQHDLFQSGMTVMKPCKIVNTHGIFSGQPKLQGATSVVLHLEWIRMMS